MDGNTVSPNRCPSGLTCFWRSSMPSIPSTLHGIYALRPPLQEQSRVSKTRDPYMPHDSDVVPILGCQEGIWLPHLTSPHCLAAIACRPETTLRALFPLVCGPLSCYTVSYSDHVTTCSAVQGPHAYCIFPRYWPHTWSWPPCLRMRCAVLCICTV